MFFKKLNNAGLWDKIQKLRELIKVEQHFKKRICWNCKKDLNIYDFLSDNVNLTPEYILRLWQTHILEFHCCECFRYLKIHELKNIEKELSERNCLFCETPMDIYKFSKFHSYLKIHEIKALWLDTNFQVFCDNLCQRKYYKTYYDFLNKRKLEKQNQLKNKN
ncbi:MAG: hypothetical protein ACFE9I_03110 [Candidatus Hermodarchaeota archaeon]